MAEFEIKILEESWVSYKVEAETEKEALHLTAQTSTRRDESDKDVAVESITRAVHAIAEDGRETYGNMRRIHAE